MIRPFLVLPALAVTLIPSIAGAQLLTKHRIPSALAAQAVNAAVSACASKGYKVTVVLVDAGGVQQAFLRGDDAALQTVELAFDKAYTSVATLLDTRTFAERAAQGQPSVAVSRLPHMVASQGGVVIKSGDEVLGALAVSGAPGGQFDEECGLAAIATIRDRLR